MHHGYFGSWIGMVAARLLGVSFSLTLHGSDLLLDGAYLDTKLENCRFCVTISEYNRRYILEHFPRIDPQRSWSRGWASMCRNAREPAESLAVCAAPSPCWL